MSRWTVGPPLLAALLAAAPLACGNQERDAAPARSPEGERTFTGAAVCAECHAAEAERWRGSHHDLAMQVADEGALLGDFDAARFRHRDTSARFFRKDGRPFVETQGPDGALAAYEVAYVFGVEPLQQLLLPLPGGRLQAFSVAWDSRPAEKGGQRWFHLYPDEDVPPGDVLHWTSPSQNWNRMCAECHSTGLRKGYDVARDAYDTTWQELDVACEACHGPGSLHVARARAAGDDAASGLPVSFASGEWRFAPGAPIAARTQPKRSDAEVETCARCHARREVLRDTAPWGLPLLDTHRPVLLDPGLYHADGQIQDEVYVWGSFVQSRMYAAGVVCSDCHDPHSLAVADPPDATCNRCHQPEVFDSAEHHHHAEDSPGASCVACHMPSRTYMVVDPRRDHSFRVPRPDLSQKLGAPDACTGCHADRDAAWADDAALRWWGPARRGAPHYGEVLHAGRRGAAGADRALAALAAEAAQPDIVRATALRVLGDFASPAVARALERGLRDAAPLVRMAAAESVQALPPPQRVALLRPALRDPVRGVRSAAGRASAAVPDPLWEAGDRAVRAAALAEYRSVQQLSADFPGAHVNLGLVYAERGALEQARGEYEKALRLAPWFVPAHMNLADLLRRRSDEPGALRALHAGLEQVPESAELHHALGLALVRSGSRKQALVALERAARLAPSRPRFAYVYAIGLHSAGRTGEALRELASARRLHPGDAELLLGLATLSRDAGLRAEAAGYARELLALRPEDASARALVAELEGPAAPR